MLGGSSQSTTELFVYDIALARYNADGSLDQTFGNGGLVKTDFDEMEGASAVAIQQDGKIVGGEIVVAGTVASAGSRSRGYPAEQKRSPYRSCTSCDGDGHFD